MIAESGRESATLGPGREAVPASRFVLGRFDGFVSTTPSRAPADDALPRTGTYRRRPVPMFRGATFPGFQANAILGSVVIAIALFILHVHFGFMRRSP